MKKCTKCGIHKELDEYHKNKMGAFGRQAECKECKKKYFLRNRDKIRKKQKEYENNNKEKIKLKDQKKYLKNKEYILERNAKYREKNKEKIEEYRKNNRDFINKRSRINYKKQVSIQPACIYSIRCVKNNKVYIGETIRGKMRWSSHLTKLRGNYHSNKKLQEDYNKYGEDAFEWSVIKETPEDKQILLLEEAREIQRRINNKEQLYNLMLTIEQLKMLKENQEKK